MSDLNTDIELFWDSCHDKNIVESLSGCQYNETIDFLKIRDCIKPGAHVLEIGVGSGHVTKGLYENKAIVSCLEISNTGVEKVKNYCEKIYMVDDLEKIPSDYFDVIICHNLVQHVPTYLLIEELKHCIRSLKVGGIFVVEFVSNDVIEDMGINPSLDEIKAGVCCRTPEYLEKLIGEIGGKCELVFTNAVDFGAVKGHHVFHVKKIKEGQI